MPREGIALAVFPPADGPTNFARDDALLAFARSRAREVMRVYSWSRPTLSFGRNERTVGRFDPQRIAAAQWDAVRRHTGGRALLHHHELTYAIADSSADESTLQSTYGMINTLLARALRALGVPAEPAGRLPGWPPPEGAACFAVPSPGELVVGTFKLVASAQWRSGDAYLQHGSILIEDDQPQIATVVHDGVELPPSPPAATLQKILGRAPTAAEFADALVVAIADVRGAEPERLDYRAIADDDTIAERAAVYRDPAWTWRR